MSFPRSARIVHVSYRLQRRSPFSRDTFAYLQYGSGLETSLFEFGLHVELSLQVWTRFRESVDEPQAGQQEFHPGAPTTR